MILVKLYKRNQCLLILREAVRTGHRIYRPAGGVFSLGIRVCREQQDLLTSENITMSLCDSILSTVCTSSLYAQEVLETAMQWIVMTF